MKTIYSTQEWKGYGKSYYHNEYRQEGDQITKVKCGRAKFFDGKESNWSNTEKEVDSWKLDADDLPEWLKKHI